MVGEGKPGVVDAAKHIIASQKYTYKQVRGPGYLDDEFMDCSEFVMQSYRRGGYPEFPEFNTVEMVKRFVEVKEAEPGDIAWWPGHVVIIENPETGAFLAARSTKRGLGGGNYKTDSYWVGRAKEMKFLRYSSAPNPK